MMKRGWERIESLSWTMAILNQLAWRLGPERREEAFAILKRVHDRVQTELCDSVSREFDSARKVADWIQYPRRPNNPKENP